MKKLFMILCILLIMVGCASSKNDFWSRKYPTENRRSYREKKGLMILNSAYTGRNSEFNSKHNNQVKKKAFRRYEKLNRIKYRRFKKF